MSTTGGLDNGATVYYVLESPTTIDLQQTIELPTYIGNNTITNISNMDMNISYIPNTYE